MNTTVKAQHRTQNAEHHPHLSPRDVCVATGVGESPFGDIVADAFEFFQIRRGRIEPIASGYVAQVIRHCARLGEFTKLDKAFFGVARHRGLERLKRIASQFAAQSLEEKGLARRQVIEAVDAGQIEFAKAEPASAHRPFPAAELFRPENVVERRKAPTHLHAASEMIGEAAEFDQAFDRRGVGRNDVRRFHFERIDVPATLRKRPEEGEDLRARLLGPVANLLWHARQIKGL